MDFSNQTILGKTGIKVGRLGISSSYGAPAAACEEAFERGCNYFSIGSFMRGRSREMIRAIRNLSANGKRSELVVAMFEYTHSRLIGQPHFNRGLKAMGLEYVDVLIMGYHPRKPRKSLIHWVMDLKSRGRIRHIAIAGHNRKLFPKLATENLFDVFHIRYNAVNSGADQDVFPLLPDDRPGIVSYTATRWGALLNPAKMPPGESPLTATDCYRFALSQPAVDVCMTGTRNLEMMRENLRTLEMGPLNTEEMQRIRRIGDHIYGKPRN